MKAISSIISASLLTGSVTAIIGGEVILDDMTYVVGVRPSLDPMANNSFSYCAGALISPSHVLTTATCTREDRAQFVSVGAHFINGDGDGEEIKVKRITIHPEFKTDDILNDFAVLTLERRTNHTTVHLPAADGSDIQSGTKGLAMGWGITGLYPDDFLSDELRGVNETVMGDEECRKIALDAYNMTIDMSLLCTYGDSTSTPCEGDTGGPLIIQNADGVKDDVLIGLISGGACAVDNKPNLYARVSTVIGWINDIIKA